MAVCGDNDAKFFFQAGATYVLELSINCLI